MGSPDEQIDTSTIVRAAVDVLVFAPLGLGVKLVEDAPVALRAARQELANARFIGRFAVDRGVAQIREQLASSRPEAAPPSPVTDDLAREETSTAVVIEPIDLALPDYDTLPAIDIVSKLASLTPAERDAIGDYEASHRRRRTVLGKLEQLAGE